MSNKLYNQVGDAAKRALEHQAANDENGEEYSESSFGGFGDYMRRKKLKLQNQDEEIRQEIKDEPQIFKGMINGYTKPPREDLHHLIVKHGGVYKQYLEGKTFVTHIIASNLTPKKRVEFERYKVVRPEWIVDCIKAGKALPWTQYRLIDRSSQTTIGFIPKSVDSYRAVSSRDEQVVYGGGGLKHELSQESSSYPTPPEMKAMDSEAAVDDVEIEEATLSETKLESMEMQEVEIPSDLSPIQISPPKPANAPYSPPVEMPSTLSPIEISSPIVATAANPSVDLPGEELLRRMESPNETSSNLEQNDAQISPMPMRPPSNTRYESPFQESKVAPSEDKAAAHNVALLQANPSLRSSTVLNPDFIRSYFDQSRLHHLSTWKADLKTQMQQLASQTPRLAKKLGGQRWIMHVDFDCFFCSVSLLSRPDLKDKPVCVGHGGGRSGEIASCNYPARKFGIHNGMFMGRALELCKDLVCLPYDFPAYEKASRDFYDILLSVGADATQAVSVDEVLLDVSSISGSPEDLAQSIRDRVRTKTQCDVSIGIGTNILLAKLALRKAKPAGQYHLKPEDAQEFMQNLDVQDLPGVGWKLSEKLEEVMNIRTVGEVRTKSLNELKEKFGPKTGEKLYEFARGIDHTEVGEIVQRKSVSVEVNWGVRFETGEQVDKFLMSLATELSSRLIKESFTGTHLMLKVMRRAADAPLDPPKHLGHGKCDTFNKSVQMGVATNNPEALGREAIMMMKSLRIPPGELRGIGLQMGKLERAGELKLEMGQKKLDFSKLPKADVQVRSPKLQPRTPPPQLQAPAPGPSQTPVQVTQFIAPTQIDPDVLANLPDDIRARIISRKPVAVQSSQIDEEVFKELPPSIQDELRQAFKKPVVKMTPTKKNPSPRKGKSGFGMVGQSKLPISSPDELDKAVLAELPSTIRQEVISNAQREHAVARAARARRLAWEAERTVRERKITRSVTIPEPPPKPTFQKMSELPELRDLIHNWFKEFRDESPAEEDVELLGGYLRKVVLIEKDLRKAEAVVKWFRSCCRETTGAAQDEWWAAGLRLVEHVNDACMERGVGKIDFDTQGL